MNGDQRHGLLQRSAYYLGVVARVSADALAYPYRRLRGAPEEPDAQRSARSALRHERALPALATTSRAPRSRRSAHLDEPPVERRRGRARREGLHAVAARAAADDGLHILAAALGDPDPQVRIAAVETLGDLDGEQAGRMIADVLHDPDPAVRVAAAEVAARAGATSAVFSLILALDDTAAEVREAAAFALERLTGQEIDLHPDDPPQARQALIDRLKRWWKQRRLSELTGG